MSTATPRFATPHDALLEAIRRIGSQQKAARACDVSQPSVWRWMRDKRECPQRFVLPLAKASGLSPQDLRPDLYWADEPPAERVSAGGIAAAPLQPINDNCCCACHRQSPVA